MPLHMIESDLAAGTLMMLEVEDLSQGGLPLPMALFIRLRLLTPSRDPFKGARHAIAAIVLNLPIHCICGPGTKSSPRPSPASTETS